VGYDWSCEYFSQVQRKRLTHRFVQVLSMLLRPVALSCPVPITTPFASHWTKSFSGFIGIRFRFPNALWGIKFIWQLRCQQRSF
jgi:hypothetical protein